MEGRLEVREEEKKEEVGWREEEEKVLEKADGACSNEVEDLFLPTKRLNGATAAGDAEDRGLPGLYKGCLMTCIQ